MVFDISLFNTQHYKVRSKCKVEQSRERSSALLNISVLSLIKREPSGRPRLRLLTLLNLYIYIYENIYYHPQTDCFVLSQLFRVSRHVGRFKLGLKPAQLYVRRSIIPLNPQSTYVSSRIIKHYVEAFVCSHFALPDTSTQFIRRAMHYASGSRSFGIKLNLRNIS